MVRQGFFNTSTSLFSSTALNTVTLLFTKREDASLASDFGLLTVTYLSSLSFSVDVSERCPGFQERCSPPFSSVFDLRTTLQVAAFPLLHLVLVRLASRMKNSSFAFSFLRTQFALSHLCCLFV